MRRGTAKQGLTATCHSTSRFKFAPGAQNEQGRILLRAVRLINGSSGHQVLLSFVCMHLPVCYSLCPFIDASSLMHGVLCSIDYFEQLHIANIVFITPRSFHHTL